MTAEGGCPEAGTSESYDLHWLDALSDAALIVAPVYGGRRRIVGFRVERANSGGARLGTTPGAGRSGAGSMFPDDYVGLEHESATRITSLLRGVLKTGAAGDLDGLTFAGVIDGHAVSHILDIHAGRHGDNLLVILRDLAAGDPSRGHTEDLRALIDRVDDEALMTIDPNGAVITWNTGARHMFGYIEEQIIGRHYSMLYPPDHAAGPDGHDRSIRTERARNDAWQIRKDGTRFWAGSSIGASYGDNGEVRGYSLVVRDLTEQAEQRRRDLQLAVMRALEAPLEINAAAVKVVELTTNAIGAKFGEVFGAAPPDGGAGLLSRLGFPRSTLDLFDAAGDSMPADPWASVISRVRATRGPIVVADLSEQADAIQAAAASALGLRSLIASPILVEFEVVGVLAYFFETLPPAESRVVETITDICAEFGHFATRIHVEDELRFEALRMTELASTDRLTGLKNRREFDRIIGTIPREPFAILAIDVDHLKRVNDEFGHEAGDTVLRTVGTTLALMLRGWDVIARVGGDEFAAILLDVDPVEAATAAQRLRAAMHLVPSPGDRSNISLGWASAPAGTDPMAVWKCADECLYAAKREGRDRVVGRHLEDIEPSVTGGAAALELITELIGGLPIHAVYQPIVDLNDGHVIGYEALARPQGYGASDSVERLFEVAHRSGQIRDLDWLCRRAALGQAVALPADALLFINVSTAALLDPLHDVDQLMLLLEWSGRSPRNLVLEIGEHEDVRDLQRFQHVLAAYRSTGVRFAIDDLGEGFATTELLASAGAEYVKLARSLTMNSMRRGSRAAITAALAFARQNDAAVIAEGVENELVSDQIRSLNVPLGQGFGLGRPSLASETLDTHAAWNARETLRPLRPRNGRTRFTGDPASRSGGNGIRPGLRPRNGASRAAS